MEVFEQLKQLIKQKDKQRIVFPEGEDPRILTAVSRLSKMTWLNRSSWGKRTRSWLWRKKLAWT